MKFSCLKEKILSVVQASAKAVTEKGAANIKDIMQGLLFKLSGDTLVIIGYNLGITIKTAVQVTGEEDGEILINAKVIQNIIKKMPSGEITFSYAGGDTLSITGEDVEFTILYKNENKYINIPEINSGVSFSISQKLLKSMIVQTKFAVSKSDVRPVLKGCRFEVKDNILSVVAIDGVRIALRQEPVNSEGISFVVPAETLDKLAHMLSGSGEKEVTILTDKENVSFDFDGYTVISELLEGEFIPYKERLNYNKEIFAEVNCREMIKTLERHMTIARQKSGNLVRYELNGSTLTISGATPDIKITSRISVKYNGDPVAFGVNPKNMLDAFKACDTDTVKMITGTPADPVIIIPTEGKAFTYLVLPMKLK